MEDEALIALDLEQALRDLHAIIVASVNNVAAALKLVAEADVDCAVLHVHLGIESLAALLPILDVRHVPRVFKTPYPEGELPKAWNTWPVLEKPLNQADLLRAIERVVGTRGR